MNSLVKTKLFELIGSSTIPMQYGGGLDDAYMNRRSAFAAPDANSAFASPMGQSGLPTIYRQEGGDIPITSVNGQGIRRIIYRESGGGMGYEGAAQDYADAYGPADPGNVDPDEGSYDSVTGMPSVTTPQGTPPPTNDGMGDAGIPLSPLNNFMINLQIKNQKAAQEKQARNQQYIQNTTKAANMANVMPGIPAVSNAAMVALQSQTPNTPQRGGVEDPETSLSQDKVSSDKSVSDLTTTEFNSLVGTLSDKMNNSQASKFSSSISNNDKVSDVVGKANDVFFNSPATNNKGFPNDSLTSYNRKSGGGLPTIYRASGGDYEADDYGNYSQADLDAAMDDPTDDGLGDVGGTTPMSPGGMGGQSIATPPASTVVDRDDFINNPDARYAELYGRSGTTDPSFTEEGTFDYRGRGVDQGFRAGDTDNMSSSGRNALLSTLRNKFGTWPAAEKALAGMSAKSIMAFDKAVNGDYVFGGAQGTLEDIFEKQMGAEFDIENELADDKIIKQYNKDDNEEFLSKAELSGRGLLDFAEDIQNKLSIQSDLTPTTMALIEARANDAGLKFQPVNSFAAGLVDFGISALGGLAFPGAGALAKGLSNMTGAGRTIGTVTKNGLNYNLSDTGKFSLNTEPTAPDYGNDEEPKKRSKPIEEKITETVTEEKPLTGMAALLARRSKPKSRLELGDKSSGQDKFEKIYNRRYRNI